MTVVNPKLTPLFEAFCKNYCKYRSKDYCMKTMDDATLDKCPAGIWWDINDYLNDVKALVARIQDSVISGK